MHWSHRREVGEHQHTSNFYRAFTDYIARFSFGNGVKFESPRETEAIVPDLLERVWDKDNSKHQVLMEMAQQGGVSGDCFIKVAYEDPYVDAVGITMPGRVRILPLNAAHCFPEWHPHDRTRLLRMKIKYRFWGCVPTSVQVCTRSGWQYHHELSIGDEILALDPHTREIRWEPLQKVSVYDYDGDLRQWGGQIDALSTPNHRWLVEDGERSFIARSSERVGGDPKVADLSRRASVVLGGGAPTQFADQAKYEDEFVEAVAWIICDGSVHTNQTGTTSIHLAGKKPHKVDAWRRLANWASTTYAGINRKPWSEGTTRDSGQATFYIGPALTGEILNVAPDKRITAEFINSLTYHQARLFHDTLIAGDGHVRRNSVRWTQVNDERREMFQWLAALLGIRSTVESGLKVQEYYRPTISAGTMEANASDVHYEGQVWCPTVESGIWFARSESGSTYWTGNTSAEGTRQVFTYVEITTDDVIEEYINDELLDSRPNPIGRVPVVHIPNLPVSGSPWGLPDCQDIISLNRQYNEVATSVADIINYHAEPITIITGAKASQLERGAKKIWAGLPKDAKVQNLEGGYQGLQAGLQYMELLKRTMHEMVGVPETALGQVQPISNTSGVALSIQFQPLMNRHTQKIGQYGNGVKRVNELVIRTLVVKEPNALIYDPTSGVPLADGQLDRLDPADPITYQTGAVFPPPLPLDKLVLLNEIQAKFALGLESREGALRLLGEEFPAEKLAEIASELKSDALSDGALALIKAQVTAEIAQMTGMMVGPDGEAQPAPPPVPTDISGDGVPDTLTGPGMPAMPDAYAQAAEQAIRERIVELAYGTKLSQRRVTQTDT